MFKASVHRVMAACALLLGLTGGVRAEAPGAIKLAVFDIELDDFRDRASSPEQPGDRYHLLLATEALKQSLSASQKYQVLNPQPTNWLASSFPNLRLCNGCEAEVASRVGAERSLLVVVTRVSMTDYVLSFQLRHAEGGALIASGSSDLRMGANYSWSRGASWLALHKIVAGP